MKVSKAIKDAAVEPFGWDALDAVGGRRRLPADRSGGDSRSAVPARLAEAGIGAFHAPHTG